jgi:hypothetical protein
MPAAWAALADRAQVANTVAAKMAFLSELNGTNFEKNGVDMGLC